MRDQKWVLPFGANIINEEIHFSVWAPYVKQLQVKLFDSSHDQPSYYDLEKKPNGFFEGSISDAKVGDHYLYVLDGEKERPDPCSRFLPETVHGPSEIINPYDYIWSDSDWKGIQISETVFYEIHIGTFTDEGTFKKAAEKIGYLKDLGVTCIEIMPVAQCPGKRNWGYDGVGIYSVQNNYGSPNDFKFFIDACHKEGIAVCLDVVYNHLGPEGNYFWDYGPYFTEKYHTPWGQALSYDDPENSCIREFFIQNALFWIHEYHIDALRLDAVHAIYDESQKHFLDELSQRVSEASIELGKEIHLIAESGIFCKKLTADRSGGGFDLTSQWVDDFHHAAHVLLTGEQQGYYKDFNGFSDWVKSLEEGSILGGQYSEFWRIYADSMGKDTDGLQAVIALQNHDQVGNRALGRRLLNLSDWESLRPVASFLLLSPYIPLLFMGEEYGEESPFAYFVDHGDPGLLEAVKKGRAEEFKGFGWTEVLDPTDEKNFINSKLKWNLFNKTKNQAIFRWYQEILKIRKKWIGENALTRQNMRVFSETKSYGLMICYDIAPSEYYFIAASCQSQEKNTEIQSFKYSFGEGDLELSLSSHPKKEFLFENNRKVELGLKPGQVVVGHWKGI